MRGIIFTRRYRKDLKRCKKRGKDFRRLERIVKKLALGEPLDPVHRVHRLSGTRVPYWECHIEHDWLLVWAESEHSIMLVGTGTHSDMFDDSRLH